MTRTKKTVIIKKPFGKRTAKTQVSPSGMAAASQAVPGEFDSRHLLQNKSRTSCASYFYFCCKIMRESRTPRGNFAYKKRLIIVFSKISRAICNCEGGGFPQEKHGLSSPAPTKHTSTTLTCKVYGSVFYFLSPFFPVVLGIVLNTIRSLIVFRAKISLLKKMLP